PDDLVPKPDDPVLNQVAADHALPEPVLKGLIDDDLRPREGAIEKALAPPQEVTERQVLLTAVPHRLLYADSGVSAGDSDRGAVSIAHRRLRERHPPDANAAIAAIGLQHARTA